MSDNKQLKIQPLRYVTISLLNTNRDVFDLFKSKFEQLILKSQVGKSEIRYSMVTPYSVVIEESYLDDAIKLAKELPANSIEISSYELDDEGNRILDTVEIHYPLNDPYLQELEELDQADENTVIEDDDATFDSDEDDATFDDDVTDNFSVNNDVEENEGDDELNINEEISFEHQTNFEGNEPFNLDKSFAELQTVFEPLEEVAEDDSLDELMPTADDILDDLNPTLMDIPTVANPVVTLTVNQHQSNLYTLYGMLGKTLSNVKAEDLTQELDKFKHSGKVENIFEVKNYLASKNSVNSKIKELNDNCELIKSEYDRAFDEWVNERIEELKAQYAEEHPDNTDEEIANYLASNKSTLDKMQLELERNKEIASQALVREFTVNQENDNLSDALRFVMIKDRAKSAIESVAHAYQTNGTDTLFNEPVLTDNVSHQDTSHDDDDDFSDIVQSMELEDEPTNDADHEEEVVNEPTVEENETVETTDENSDEPDFENMTDDELIEYYNKHMSGNDNETNNESEQPAVEDAYQELSHEDVVAPEDTSDLFNIETLPVEEKHETQETQETLEVKEPDLTSKVLDDLKETNDRVENQPIESQPLLDDDLDLGLTKPVPVISDEDIEQMAKMVAEENEKSANPDLAETKVIEKDALVDGGTDGESYEFKEIGEDVIDFDEVESTLNKSKKKKKQNKKKKPSEKADKSADKSKKQSKGLNTAMKAGVIALFAASIGTVGYFGYKTIGSFGSKPAVTANSKSKSTDDLATVKKFFEEAKLYGIDVDKEIVVPVDGSNVNVTITALNSDGSITVKDEKGNNYNIPYTKVKAFIDDEKSKYDASLSSSSSSESSKSSE